MSTNKIYDGEEIVLSYHDCLLRVDDVNLLAGPHWLNDAIIGFYFEYLEHRLDDRDDDSCDDILFVSPEMTQLLKLTSSSEFPALMDSLSAADRKYIFFPLNNCDSREAAGGSHWSLLVVSQKKTVFHLDSCRGTNRSVAVKFANKIMDYFSAYGAKNMEELKCPQQENGYDCGLFTLCLTDTIVQHILRNPEIRECNFDGVKSTVSSKRNELLGLIEKLKSDSKTGP